MEDSYGYVLEKTYLRAQNNSSDMNHIELEKTMSDKSEGLTVKQLFDRESCTYSYLIYDAETKQGALIDSVNEQLERDLALIDELGIELNYVLETHAHADHITAAGKIRQRTGAKIGYSKEANIKGIDLFLNDGDILALGKHQVTAIATPGHTSGCMSYVIREAVFTGDALLIRGCGRTDFQQGSAKLLYQSIHKQLFSLPSTTLVYPAHDYNGRISSTIEEEMQWNKRLGQQKSEHDFIEIMDNLNLDVPKKINEAVPANEECGLKYDPGYYIHDDFSMQDLYVIWSQHNSDFLILDNRSEEEFNQGHIPNSKNIPLGHELESLQEIKKFGHVYMYCHSGRRAQTAAINLSLAGIHHITTVSHTGFPDWKNAGFPCES
jgi:sulfur dioxygenase